MLSVTWLILLAGCERRTGYYPPDTDTDTDPDTASETEEGEAIIDEAVLCTDPLLRDTQGAYERIELEGLSLQEFDTEPDMTLASGISVGDIDGDGLLDLIIPQAGPTQLLVQQPDGSFVDETALRWPEVADAPGASAAQVVDLDGDGHLDVFTCSGAPIDAPPALYYNQLFLGDGQGGLVNASAAWGLEEDISRPCFGVSFGDIDGDGDLDMAAANNEACPYDIEANTQDCEAILEQGSSQVLWENQGDRLVDVSDTLPAEAMLSSFMHVTTLLDLDGDGDLDLYITNDDKQEISFSAHNYLLRNDGTGQLTLDEGGHGLDISIAGMGVGVADLNDDALPDIVISGTSRAALMLSAGELGWADSAIARGIIFEDPSHIEAWGTALADIDNDGDLDVPFVFGWLTGDTRDETIYKQPDALFLSDGEQYTESAAQWGFDDDGIGRGMVVVDLDGDGWLDIIKRELGGTALVYRARCGEAAWSQLTLQQDGPNPSAIGAVVTLTADGVTQRRWVLGAGTSFGSNAAVGPHFGLGGATEIEEIRVRWPDGEQTVYSDLPVRTPLTLTRP
ncbi:MAG: hypothetical protein ACI8S6_001483 [Myxococcota bacterium]|jgi:hypothetical protein